MAGYIPAANGHSIDQAVIGLRLKNDASDENFERAVGIADELKGEFDLHGRLKLDALALMGRQSITPGYKTQLQLQPGFVFQKVNVDGTMNQEMTLEKDVVTFRTRNYSRWSDIEGLIDGLIVPVGSALADGKLSNIAVIELRITDRFVTSDGRPANLSELIKGGAPLVPPYLMEKAECLHSHMGWFEDVSEHGRVLVNLNIDLRDDPEVGRTSSILQVVSKQSTGSDEGFFGVSEWSDALLTCFAELHARDKAILGSVLRDDLAAAINLEGSTGVGQL
jgi:hypothetical protein